MHASHYFTCTSRDISVTFTGETYVRKNLHLEFVPSSSSVVQGCRVSINPVPVVQRRPAPGTAWFRAFPTRSLRLHS